MSVRDIVMIGGGQASAVATRTLRRRGYDGSITIVGDEPLRPYQRPPLSKEYLTAGNEAGLFLLPETWTDDHDVRVLTGSRALKISASDTAVLLEDGTSLVADRVLLATGGSPRRLPDTEGDRIVYLRTKADADALRARLKPGQRLVVVGAGFIGAEIASSAHELGVDVVVLEAAATPLAHVLGPTLGEACARLHRDAGVDLRVDAHVTGVRQEGDVVVVRTTEAGRDRVVEGDVVVIGIGIVPNDAVATGSGLEVDNGVLVDEHCRTSVPQVFAAGDVANQLHPLHGTRIRAEHFDTASKQGAVAANNMIGRTAVFGDPHWFWSDQYGTNLQYVGRADPGTAPVLRGSPGDETWSAFFVDGSRLRAAFAVNGAEDIMVARELIAAGVPVDAARLTDPDLSLMDLMEEL